MDITELQAEKKDENQSLFKNLKTLQLSEKLKASVLKRLKERTVPGKPLTNIAGPCQLWTGCQDKDAYGWIHIGRGIKKVHRAAYEVRHNVELPSDIQVRHLCANPLCVAEAHLAIGTAQDNANDKVASGRSIHGEKHPNAKITKEIAIAVYNDANPNAEEVAVKFSCTEATVRHIRAGSSWNSVTGAKKKEAKAKKQFDLDPKDEKKAQKYIEERIEKSVENEHHEHWIWKQSKYPDGYGKAMLHGKNYSAHVLAWRAFHKCQKIPKGKQIIHSCKRRDCVNPDGLQLGTRQQNMADKVRDGTHSRGVKNPSVKLTEEKVQEIRKLHSKGVSTKTLAEKFRVATHTICQIASGKAWKHMNP